MTPRRGEIWDLDFGEPLGREQAGYRPAVVVSHDTLNDGPSEVVIVVPVTKARRGLPTHIELEDTASTGLTDTSYAKCEDVKSVSTLRLVRRRGSAPADAMLAIGRALRYLLDL